MNLRLTTGRTKMDKIREAALMLAIDYHHRLRINGTVEEVLATAGRFEAYIRYANTQASGVSVETVSNLPYDPDSTQWVIR